MMYFSGMPISELMRNRKLPFRRIFAGLIGLSFFLAVPADSHAQAAGLPTALHNEIFKAGEALVLEAPADTASFLNSGYAIDSEGYVDLPILGRVLVAGQTREVVQTFLGAKLANYLRDTHVIVRPAIRITLLGYWGRPGQYYISPDATLFEAVRPAGGIAGEQTLGDIHVMRGDAITDISFLNHYSQQSSLAKAGIQSGDIVVVPVPREDVGFWYWFRETLTVTAQIATIAGGFLSIYVTYLLLEDRERERNLESGTAAP
jgi:Polysaccharide biosynthesis/export protein